jgi:hypothetical protein
MKKKHNYEILFSYVFFLFFDALASSVLSLDIVTIFDKDRQTTKFLLLIVWKRDDLYYKCAIYIQLCRDKFIVYTLCSNDNILKSTERIVKM